MSPEELRAVVAAIGTLGLAVEQLAARDPREAAEARLSLGALTASLDRLTAGAVDPSPRRPTAVVDLAARRRQRGGAR